MFESGAFSERDFLILLDKLKPPLEGRGFEGFKLFSPETVRDVKRYFAAFYDEELIGVLALGQNRAHPEGWYVSYISVRADWNGKGVATALYKALNEWASPSMVVYGSTLTAEGERARLYDLRQRIVTRCACLGSRDDFYKYLVENGKIPDAG